MFIKKLMFNRTLIFILVFTILFNFITIPKKVHAEVLTMSYGFYIFLKAAYAAGLTYIVVDRVTEDGIKLYQEWQKFNENKPDPPDDGQRNAIANLLGLGLVDSFGNLVDSVKDFFISLGAKEGDNIFSDIYIDLDNNYVNQSFELSNFRVYSSSDGINATLGIINIDGYTCIIKIVDDYIYAIINGVLSNRRLISFGSTIYKPEDIFSINISVSGYYSNTTGNLGVNFSSEQFRNGKSIRSASALLSVKESSIHGIEPPQIELPNIINYNITNNSYILTDDKNDIKKMSPNIDILPKEKLEIIATPDGYYKKYIGDDLVDDYIESIPNNFPGDLFEKTPGEFVETDWGIVFVPDGSPVPSPYPKPDPKPDPDPDPKPDPDPDPYSDPYPDIVEEDVEIPKGLGKIIALLKELINWSSRIFNKEEIDKESEPDKPGLFEIPEDLNLDLDPLKNLAIIEKFPFSLPWDLKNAVNLLVSPAEPPKWTVPIVSEEIEIDLSEFESLAFISRSFFTILFIIALVIATRRFIGGA